MKAINYQIQYSGGIPFEWWYEIDKACATFFRKRGMPVTGPTLKELMHREAVARMKEKQHEKNIFAVIVVNDTKNAAVCVI